MLSWTHILVVAGITLLLFGRGRISDMMGDVAKGIKSFKKGLSDEPETPAEATPAEAQRAELQRELPRPLEPRSATGEPVRPEERTAPR